MTGEQDLLLAIDFGLKRIGIASANTLTRTATPVSTLEVGAGLPWRELDALVDEWHPSVIVVGVPESTGDEQVRGAIDDFVSALRHRYSISVETVDESNTSASARSALREGRALGQHRRRVDKGRIDRHAACLIAERWMTEVRDGA